MITPERLEEYYEVIQEIAHLEERKSALGEALLAGMKEYGVDKLQAEFGTFSLVKTTKYTFSEEVKAYEEGTNTYIKALKEQEKEQGIAEAEEKEILRFQAKK